MCELNRKLHAFFMYDGVSGQMGKLSFIGFGLLKCIRNAYMLIIV